MLFFVLNVRTSSLLNLPIKKLNLSTFASMDLPAISLMLPTKSLIVLVIAAASTFFGTHFLFLVFSNDIMVLRLSFV